MRLSRAFFGKLKLFQSSVKAMVLNEIAYYTSQLPEKRKYESVEIHILK